MATAASTLRWLSKRSCTRGAIPEDMTIHMTEDDLTYIRANYLPLAALVEHRAESIDEARAHVAALRMPAPAYVLPDGTEMFPRDWFALADQAGGVERLRAEFERRFRA